MLMRIRTMVGCALGESKAARGLSMNDRIAYLVLVGFIVSLAPSARAQDGEDFFGCGPTQDSAREALAKNIGSRVESAYEDLMTVEGEKETQRITASVNVQSQLDLRGIRMNRQDDGTYCAFQSPEPLRQVFESALKLVFDSCDPQADNFEERLSQCRRQVTTAKTLFALFRAPGAASSEEFSRLFDRSTAIEAAAARALHQSVTFTVASDGRYDRDKSVVVVDEASYGLGEAIPLAAGSIDYAIQVPGYCPIRGRLRLKKGTERVPVDERVSHDLSDATFPVIVFVSSERGALFVDGKPSSLSQQNRVDRCSGTLPWRFNAADGQVLDGEVDLEPGQEETEEIVVSDRKFLARMSKAWDERTAVMFRYGGGVPLRSNIDTNWVQTVQVDYMAVYGPIRYGGGILYGYAGPKDHQFEGYLKLVAQVTRVGDYPLHIGSNLAFIPYIGVEGGLGYHGLRPEDTRTRGDFGSVTESIIVFRGVLGTSLTLNERFSLVAEYNWAFVTHERRMGLSLGLAVLF